MTAVTQLIPGQPADVSADINNIGLGQRPSGTGAESVRGYFTADPNESKGRDKFFNYETIRLPSVAEARAAKGAYPRNFLSRPGINVTERLARGDYTHR